MLWGNDAREFAAVAEAHGHAVHAWTHPSPLADNRLPPERKFQAYPGFAAVNAALVAAGDTPVCWVTSPDVVVYADGACAGNGTAHAAAGFAAVAVGGPFGADAAPTFVRGRVLPCRYELAGLDVVAIEGAAVPALPTLWGGAAAACPPPTNNRGEILAVIWAFLILLRMRVGGVIQVRTDSLITVRTLNEWLPARRRRGTEKELANLDLLLIAEALLSQLPKATITHVRGHQVATAAESPQDAAGRRGNDAADRHAAEAAAGDDELVFGGPQGARIAALC
jgi:ribonuclease HI